MLHHSQFDCNYGNQQIPWDWIFGTYAGISESWILIGRQEIDDSGSKNEVKQIWGQKHKDEIKKHAQSATKYSVS